ncbi:hypothetical protein Cgig2_007895 [Carnegiea gigantea]|uniref:Membrane-associated kinase regulator 5 n=1 Tax=Carnegiea gigantea TaxID=171969 RepID=A0A9Q1KF36_9CARY|nr:hypothetical protein Cgig2_007895 [Carnegiea gigantea]
MEVFALLKFWKSNTAKVAAGTTASDGDETISDSAFYDPLMSEEDDDDDDSFFELELTLPDSDSKVSKSESCIKNSEQERVSEPKQSSKPQSPISILRSASPKLQVFMFGKLRRKSKLVDLNFETESVSSNLSPRKSSSNSNLFTVNFRIEDGSIVPKFARNDSSSLFSPKRSSDNCNESSGRFSKDVVQKYLNMIKLPYAKSSKKNGETEKFAASPARSTASVQSPRKVREEKQSSRFKAKCKNLRKSKSASATLVSPSPVSFPARNDHPHDGIEGAILHCKRSLNSSTGRSSLSRCSSDPSQGKSVQLSEQI